MPSLPKRIILTAVCLFAVMFGDIFIHSDTIGRLATALHRHAPDKLEHLFWDTEPYSKGIDYMLSGRSPYADDDINSLLPFAYPPVFAAAGAVLAHALPAPWGWRTYIALFLLCAVAIQLILVPFFLRSLRPAQVITLLILLPVTIFMSTVFWSGNIHLVWFGLGLLAAIPGLRRNQWLPFYAVTLLAAINQPLLATILLLPLFAGRRQWVPGAITVALAGAAYYAQPLLAPRLYSEFVAIVKAHLAVSHDYGQNIFGILVAVFTRFHLPAAVPLGAAIQVAISLAIFARLIVLRRRVNAQDHRWWALLALAIVLINPRIMPYDAALGIAPALYFLLRTRPHMQWAIAFVVMLLCAAFHKSLGLTPLLIAGFLLGHAALSAEPHTAQNTAAA